MSCCERGKCGKCCELNDPYLDVWVVDSDPTPLELTEMREGYLGTYGRWMKRKSNNFSCIAFDTDKRECMIYENRPQECRDFNQNHSVCKKITNQ